MIEVILLLSVSYFLFFILFAFLKSNSYSLDKIIFCPVCFSWAINLIIGFVLEYPPLLLAFMVGMTVTGLAYYIQINKKKEFIFDFFLLQLVFTIIGLIIINFIGG